MSQRFIEEFEGYFAIVVFGKFKNLARALKGERNSIRKTLLL
jgi:hypothetical protein